MDTNENLYKGIIKRDDIPAALNLKETPKDLDGLLAAIAKAKNPTPTTIIINNRGVTMMGILTQDGKDNAYLLTKRRQVSPGSRRFCENGDHRLDPSLDQKDPDCIKDLYISL